MYFNLFDNSKNEVVKDTVSHFFKWQTMEEKQSTWCLHFQVYIFWNCFSDSCYFIKNDQ